MIGTVLSEILKEKGISAHQLAQKAGITNSTLYSILKRNNMKVSIDVMSKICNALDVDIELFYSDYLKEKKKEAVRIALTPKEEKIIKAYRENTEMQIAIDKLLGIE